MIIGFDWNTQYAAGNPVWFWGATSGFPNAEAAAPAPTVYTCPPSPKTECIESLVIAQTGSVWSFATIEDEEDGVVVAVGTPTTYQVNDSVAAVGVDVGLLGDIVRIRT